MSTVTERARVLRAAVDARRDVVTAVLTRYGASNPRREPVSITAHRDMVAL
ncbi:hypothetical protein GSU68_10030 [Rathayibacter sp. VKM Ac-2759]|uniref:hypothetical protein n=1 Tax=Rathayibacter sp. VKM Ac-2759 TaxID=2609252 RepID=UPI001319337E|nr:hypothetical protein [Rathayibacter sp. VKM Ac-2759]QHC66866.1 hypothetical protein GSU68_10030 [Rathayibacter sp. VKM Ac-2759]